MPHKQHHRGKHPEDARLFSKKWIPILREAAADLSFLFSRGYSEKSALKLVGDHYQLDQRQRRGVLGAACSEASLEYRQAHVLETNGLAGQTLRIDGYNILISVESAMAGGILLRGRDGCIRDLASVHGSYHKVEETLGAIHALGRTLERLNIAMAHWYFDAPVSNSGRLKALLYEEAEKFGWNWHIELDHNPDKILAESDGVAVTSDGWILDRASNWANVGEVVTCSLEPRPEVIDLGSFEGRTAHFP